MHLGKLTWPDKPALQDYCKVTLQHTVTATKANYSFLLPFHKADYLFEGNHILIQTTNTDDNPITAFNTYLQSCDTKFPLNPELWLHANSTILTLFFFFFGIK
jgi:hypothetical protein